jgi:hypothetical protein
MTPAATKETAIGNRNIDRKNPSPLTPFSSRRAHNRPKTMVPATNTTVSTSKFHMAC